MDRTDASQPTREVRDNDRVLRHWCRWELMNVCEREGVMIRHTHPTHTTFVTYIYTRIVKYTSISHTHTLALLLGPGRQMGG